MSGEGHAVTVVLSLQPVCPVCMESVYSEGARHEDGVITHAYDDECFIKYKSSIKEFVDIVVE